MQTRNIRLLLVVERLPILFPDPLHSQLTTQHFSSKNLEKEESLIDAKIIDHNCTRSFSLRFDLLSTFFFGIGIFAHFRSLFRVKACERVGLFVRCVC